MSRSAFLALALLFATPAFAHPGAGSHDGFAHGFVHPILGFDHVLAMVAVVLGGIGLARGGQGTLPRLAGSAVASAGLVLLMG